MNCEEVQKYLPDFLDESLDVECAAAIEDHLATCSLCNAEVASLAECQRLVSGLPLVEPPVNFTRRVMAEVREIPNPPRLWEWLFSSLRIKIPLQATALVLIAVFAAYIYQKEPLQNPAPPGTSVPTPPPQTKEVTETKARVQELKDLAQLKKTQPPSKPEERQKRIAGNQFVAPEAARSQDQIRSPATVNPIPLQEKPSLASESLARRLEKSSPPVEVQARRSLAPGSQPEKESASSDALAAGKPLLSPEGQGRRATSSIGALSSGTVVGVALPADYELAIRLRNRTAMTKPQWIDWHQAIVKVNDDR
jgi:Predicted integral membrane protein (DUF2275)/Putative zinc-finger